MPNRKTHTTVGGIAGAGLAVARNPTNDPIAFAVEGLGGFLGGRIGGALPDVLEPATTPRHRATGHSVTAAAWLVSAAGVAVGKLQRFCRVQAERWERRAQRADSFAGAFCYFVALCWRLAAGFFAGVQGGYVSHLLLDAGTPAGLPII